MATTTETRSPGAIPALKSDRRASALLCKVDESAMLIFSSRHP